MRKRRKIRRRYGKDTMKIRRIVGAEQRAMGIHVHCNLLSFIVGFTSRYCCPSRYIDNLSMPTHTTISTTAPYPYPPVPSPLSPLRRALPRPASHLTLYPLSSERSSHNIPVESLASTQDLPGLFLARWPVCLWPTDKEDRACSATVIRYNHPGPPADAIQTIMIPRRAASKHHRTQHHRHQVTMAQKPTRTLYFSGSRPLLTSSPPPQVSRPSANS